MAVAVSQLYIDKGRRRSIRNNLDGGSGGTVIERIKIRPTRMLVAVAWIDEWKKKKCLMHYCSSILLGNNNYNDEYHHHYSTLLYHHLFIIIVVIAYYYYSYTEYSCYSSIQSTYIYIYIYIYIIYINT